MEVLSWPSAKRGCLQLVLLPGSGFKMCLILTPVLPFQDNSSFYEFWSTGEILTEFFLLFLHHHNSSRHKRFPALPLQTQAGIFLAGVSPSIHSLHNVLLKKCLGRDNVCISCIEATENPADPLRCYVNRGYL